MRLVLSSALLLAVSSRLGGVVSFLAPPPSPPCSFLRLARNPPAPASSSLNWSPSFAGPIEARRTSTSVVAAAAWSGSRGRRARSSLASNAGGDVGDDGTSAAVPAVQRRDLPDYGKTPVDVSEIKLTPKQSKWRRRDLDGQTLVDRTLSELRTDVEFQKTSARLGAIGADGMTKEERLNRRRALNNLGIDDFNPFLKGKGVGDEDGELNRNDPEVLQLNIGLYCNQACSHCHVESSPLRTESMTSDVAARCLQLLRDAPTVRTLDITGGAPELNENFRYLVRMAREMRGEEDLDIIDRCNLTVLHEPGQEDLARFLADHRVRVVASLPCYSSTNVNAQRGSGVFERSISALIMLNEVGYGASNGGLKLDLVYNPLGAFLPPEQSSLEAKYKEVLEEDFGIKFNTLYTMTNMPIKRFADFLYRRNELEEYMDLLVRNFNVDTIDNLMCRNTVSVRHDGTLFDCDFNQQLGYAIGGEEVDGDEPRKDASATKASSEFGLGKSVFDIELLADLKRYKIRDDNHCFGCTAGMGSS